MGRGWGLCIGVHHFPSEAPTMKQDQDLVKSFSAHFLCVTLARRRRCAPLAASPRFNILSWLLVGLCVLLTTAGCRPHTTAAAGDGRPVDVASLAHKPHPAADLTRPFNVLAWNNSGARRDPLSVAAQLAASAGGDWLAALLKPADDVKWQPPFPPGGNRRMWGYDGERDTQPDNSVTACIAQIRQQGTPLVHEIEEGRVLLFFGT